jgi:integrase/recombinase XerD
MLTTALRSFLGYGWYRGVITRDLVSAVPTVPHWSTTSIPRAIAPEQVQRLLLSMERWTALGRRDHAIVLLLARLGLRAGEVTRLELGDIDWQTGRLRLRRKGGRTMDLPLPADVGEAIVAYLRRGRPSSLDRRVFLQVRAPHRGLRTIGKVVRSALQWAGVDAPTKGTHQFRHGLATEMLRRGASLVEIGDVLGHRSMDSTRLYAHVDVPALRTIALPWPGGVR